MLREYSPHATAYAVRCKEGVLRAWRSKGLFDGLSERKGKGHLFTLSDVTRIAIAAFIARSGANLSESFEIVRERGAVIDSVVAAERSTPGAMGDYFLTFVIDPDVSFPASVTSAPVAKIEFESDPFGVLQVNVSKLSRSVLDRLAAFEDGAA